MFNRSRWFAFATLILFGYFAIHSGWFEFMADRAQVASYLQRHGISGLLVMTLAGATFTGLGAPRQLLAFVLGFSLGGISGTLLSTLAAAIGATGCFFTARWLLRKSLSLRFNQRMSQFNDLFREQTLLKVLMVRLMPVGSNVIINLLAGCSGIRYVPFLAGSTIGYLPQMLVFALAGAGIGSANEYQLILSFVLFVIASVIGAFLYYNHRTRIVANSAYDPS